MKRFDLKFLVLPTLLSICLVGATRDATTISTAQPRLDSHQDECIGDSSNNNCVGTNQEDISFPYDPNHSSTGVEEGLDISGLPFPKQYPQDRLDDLDLLAYRSRDPTSWQAPDQDTLKQVLFIHRHGDRTPITFAPKDNLANESFWAFHGLGQLTNRGKARLHVLGKIMRHRYNKFLGGSVNKNFRKTRASGSLRCIESAQAFLSSFLSLGVNDSPDAKGLVWDKPRNELAQLWQPASILTLSAKYDGLLNEGSNCINIGKDLEALDNSDDYKRTLEEFKHEAEVLKNEIGFEIDHFYKWFWAASFLEVERSYFPHKVKPSLLAIYDRLQIVGDRTLVMYQKQLSTKRLRAGLLVNDIIENMNEIRNGSQSPFAKKFVHYSAHDINLIFLLGILNNIEKFHYRPDYASNIAFELHQDNDEWFIKIYYMPHVPSQPLEVHVDACEAGHPKSRCTLEKFETLMQKYRIGSWMEWMQECGNPLSSVNPYEQNS